MNSRATLKYIVFDSVSTIESDLIDRGFNFRDKITASFVLDSLHIWQVNYLGGKSIRYWYRFASDTLIIMYDSVGSFPNSFIKQSSDNLSDNWTERLVWTNFTTVFRSTSGSLSTTPLCNSLVKDLTAVDGRLFCTATGRTVNELDNRYGVSSASSINSICITDWLSCAEILGIAYYKGKLYLANDCTSSLSIATIDLPSPP